MVLWVGCGCGFGVIPKDVLVEGLPTKSMWLVYGVSLSQLHVNEQG